MSQAVSVSQFAFRVPQAKSDKPMLLQAADSFNKAQLSSI